MSLKPPYEDAVVVVTGASTGLGRAIAVGAADQGAKAVVINYASSEQEAEETARQVRALGADAVVVRGDVAEDADCVSIAAAAARFGRIDALVHVSGFAEVLPIEQITPELTDRVMPNDVIYVNERLF